jgi:hypothetical protein
VSYSVTTKEQYGGSSALPFSYFSRFFFAVRVGIFQSVFWGILSR